MNPVVFLPALPIHSPDWADTREARSLVRLHSSGIEAALGEQASLLGQDLHGGMRWRVGLEGSAFMGFQPEGELTFDLLTFDGIFGVPIDLAWRSWQLRLEWSHHSAHFADGIRNRSELPDESELGAFSRETLGLSLGRELSWFHPYLGSRWIMHSADGGEGVLIQLGVVMNARSSPGLYGGVDLKSSQELDWAPTGALEIGLKWEEKGGGLQLGLCGYSGTDDAGKNLGKKKQYLGLTLGLRPSRRLR